MRHLDDLQIDKIRELSKYDKVDIGLLVTTFHKEFEGCKRSIIREQLVYAYLDGAPKNKDLLTISEQWLIRHLIDNVKLYKMPSRPNTIKLTPSFNDMREHKYSLR